jgi:hypothetical protein
MSVFDSFIEGAQQTPEVAQFRPCCHGAAQLIRDLAEAARDGNLDAKTATERLSVAYEKLPSSVTAEDAAELRGAMDALKNVMGSTPDLSHAHGAVAVIDAAISLHVQAAQAGDGRSPQLSTALGEAAVKVVALVKEQPGGATSTALLATVQARADAVIKEAHQANPLFGLSMVSTATGGPTRQSDLPKERLGREVEKVTPPEQKVATSREPARSAETLPNARASESARQSPAEEVKTSRPSLHSTDATPNSQRQPPQVDTPQGRQPPPEATFSPATVAKLNTPTTPPTSVAARYSDAPPTTASTPSAKQVSAYAEPQRLTAQPVGGRASLNTHNSDTASGITGKPTGERNVARPMPLGSARTAPQTRAVPPLRVANTAITNRVSLRTTASTKGNGELSRTESLRRRGTPVPQAQTEAIPQRGVGGTRTGPAVRIGSPRGAAGISADGGVNSTSQRSRVLTTLAQLRTLSVREFKAIQLNRPGRPKEVQVALAIRARAQKIAERIKSLPLKDIQRMRALRSGHKAEKTVRTLAHWSEREILARREVRLLIRDLAVRLQAFVNPWSMLYKRLVSELTLADLERLVSMLGGNRAVRGLRKKHQAGEVPLILETDISNSFLSQLAAAADGTSAGADSSGSDESSPSADEATIQASTEEAAEETSLVAEGAVPTATLSTVIIKEESPSSGL